ncbi:response regulator [Chitinispirillales bacterium ANBcel5]|uniref:response regulator n=1 Tax=Cellulosispirillum alkaliphilum TaxID=3039283 RepID=UPI002A4E97EA|nr:response regulator [Chitinispirillales bacterium ANBcel5]
MNTKTHTILLVDDEPEIREMICDYLMDFENYHVLRAENANEAIGLLEQNRVDLILSDINMPGIKGFDLLQIVRDRFPTVKRVLITAYNVEEYLQLAMDHDIGNIFVKTAPFNFGELSSVLRNLLAGNIFGIKRYFSENVPVYRYTVNKSNCLDQDARKIISTINDYQRAKRIELVLIELLTNAIFYGVRNESPETKESWNHCFELNEESAVEVLVGSDREKYVISVRDKGGRLKKQDVLYWLNRQASYDEKGLPLGLYDSHGRGLFIARRYIDRLIINIDKDKQTEVVMFNYCNHTVNGHKPLYINEI